MCLLNRGIYAVIIITITALLCPGKRAYSNDATGDTFRAYKEAWNYVEDENIEKARELVKKYYKTEKGEYKVFWLIIESTTYLIEKDYEKSLNIIEPFRSILKERYYFLKKNPEAESTVAKELVNWNYQKLLTVSSTANFKLGNWVAALTDMIEESSNGFENDNYYLKAVCFYHTKNYPEALINFQYAYKSSESEELRDEAAYNIACIYSLMNDVNQVITWLKIPLKRDRKSWFPKIYKDKDFNKIKDDQMFYEFLKEQKHLFDTES